MNPASIPRSPRRPGATGSRRVRSGRSEQPGGDGAPVRPDAGSEDTFPGDFERSLRLVVSLERQFDDEALVALCGDLEPNLPEAVRASPDLRVALVKHFGDQGQLDVLDDAMKRALDIRALPRSLPAPPKRTVVLFLSYSHKDERYRRELMNDLEMLQEDGLIEAWWDGRISAGDEVDEQIAEKLEQAHVILLLVSRPFLSSTYIRNTELPRAMQRHEEGAATVIPIIIRPAPWSDPPFRDSFGKLRVLPKDGKPITKWRPRDDAFVECFREIRTVIVQMLQNTPGEPGAS